MISLELRGVDAVVQNLQRLAQPKPHVLGEALRDEGNRIMNESARLVPVDTGLLRSTAAVEQPRQEGPIASVTLRYGGYGMAPYAARVEWDVTLNHPHGGQAHFLQAPVFAATSGFTQRIAASIAQGLLTP
jgi:hypothetical protein